MLDDFDSNIYERFFISLKNIIGAIVLNIDHIVDIIR